MTGPWTPFPDLDRVLAALVDGAREVLGANFVGAYLQGSFALGDGDRYSDVDWAIALREDADTTTEAALNAMHARLHALPAQWAQHLEGSYFPLAVLRDLATAPVDVPGQPRPPDWRDPNIGRRRKVVLALGGTRIIPQVPATAVVRPSGAMVPVYLS